MPKKHHLSATDLLHHTATAAAGDNPEMRRSSDTELARHRDEKLESPDAGDCDDIESDTLVHDVDGGGEDVLTPELQSLNMLLSVARNPKFLRIQYHSQYPIEMEVRWEQFHRCTLGITVDALPESAAMSEVGLVLAV